MIDSDHQEDQGTSELEGVVVFADSGPEDSGRVGVWPQEQEVSPKTDFQAQKPVINHTLLLTGSTRV